MKAVVLDRFGGPEELKVREVPIPDIGENDVLIRVEYAGIGQWDSFEREGGYNEMLGLNSTFPYILGSEGAGIISAKGNSVDKLDIGDKVYAPGFLNSRGGFYAEYVALDSNLVMKVPEKITMQEASVISGVGITALRGIEDVLGLKRGESILIFGAGGGVGHMAAQIAKYKGARVLAIASGDDSVAILKELGIYSVIDGRREDFMVSAKQFAPEGFDAALLTAGLPASVNLGKLIRRGGHIAYPYGISPSPEETTFYRITGYHGEPEPGIIKRLNNFIQTGVLNVHIDNTFLMEDIYKAHLALSQHYVGKLCLKME